MPAEWSSVGRGADNNRVDGGGTRVERRRFDAEVATYVWCLLAALSVAAPGDQTGLAEDQAKVCTVGGRGPKEHPQPTCRPNGAQRLPCLPFGLRWPVVRA